MNGGGSRGRSDGRGSRDGRQQRRDSHYNEGKRSKQAGDMGKQSRGAGGHSRSAERQEHLANKQDRSVSRNDRASDKHGRTPERLDRAPDKHGTSASRIDRAADKHARSATLLKMGRIKGEWMEIRLPDGMTGAPMSAIAPMLPIPPKMLQRLVQTKGALLSGNYMRLRLFRREERDFPPDWMELNILYEDEFTLVVNKPAGIEVHPSEKGQRRTLAHAVAAYYEMTGQDVRIRHIHRIDKETTGPVLYAKNEFAHYQYDLAMRKKQIERIYVALAEGPIEDRKGTINKPIGQDRHHPTRRRISETGDPAVTHYEVVERFAEHTLVRLQLETGRTHQIRVHLSAINHPLAGDGLYGGKRGIISRQALHGEQLIWRHPWTGEKQQVRAPLPDDFVDALRKLREHE